MSALLRGVSCVVEAILTSRTHHSRLAAVLQGNQQGVRVAGLPPIEREFP